MALLGTAVGQAGIGSPTASVASQAWITYSLTTSVRTTFDTIRETAAQSWSPEQTPYVVVDHFDERPTLDKRPDEKGTKSNTPNKSKEIKPLNKLHRLCRLHHDNAESARSLWKETGAGAILDDWVSNIDANSNSNWFTQFQETFLGNPDFMDCDLMTGGNCKIDHAVCNEMAEGGLAGHYWVLKAVSSMNSFLLHLRESIKTKSHYFEPSKIVKVWEEAEVEYPVRLALQSIATAFQVAETAEAPIRSFTDTFQDKIGKVQVLNPAEKLSLVSEVLRGITLSPKFVSELESRGESRFFSDILKDLGQRYLGLVEGHLQTLIWIAIGHGDPSDLPEGLLAGGDKHKPKSDIAKLFADGKWLLEGIEFDLQPFLDQSMLLITQKFVFDMFRFQKKTMVVDAQNRISWCKNDISKGHIAHRIMQMELGADSCVLFEKKRFDSLTPEQEAMLVNDYGMNTTYIFDHMWQCAKGWIAERKDNMKPVPVGMVETSGALPSCYFAIQIYVGNRYDWVWNRKDNVQYLFHKYTAQAIIDRENMISNKTIGKWEVFGLGIPLPDGSW